VGRPIPFINRKRLESRRPRRRKSIGGWTQPVDCGIHQSLGQAGMGVGVARIQPHGFREQVDAFDNTWE